MGGCPVLILLIGAIGSVMAKLSVVEADSVIAPCFICPTVVIPLLVHRALTPEIGDLLVSWDSEALNCIVRWNLGFCWL